MGLWRSSVGLSLLMCVVVACQPAATERNPFLGFTEEYGVPTAQQTISTSGGSADSSAETPFRATLVLTFRNSHPSADLNTAFVAWVNVSSIRSAAQQDALLRGGYVQLTRETRLGTAFTLPVGTFVYQGSGTAGATSVTLGPGQAAGGATAAAPTTRAFTLVTPDAVLAFVQPPSSCDSIAFLFSQDGVPLNSVPFGGAEGPFSGATSYGGLKTLAQVDAYQCTPFRPGLFFSRGGMREANEYFEGEDITFDFNPTPDANGNFCFVTIGAATATIDTGTSGEQEQGGLPSPSTGTGS